MVAARPAAALAGIVALLAAAGPAHAQSIDAVDQILNQFKTSTGTWASGLLTAAQGTFAALAAIQLAWALIRASFNRHSDMSELMGELVNQAIFLGFFSFLMLNASGIGIAIIDSFRAAASGAGGIGVTPGEVLALGITLASNAASGITALPYSAMPGAIICCAVIVVMYALMTARLLTTVAKSIFWVNAGVFLFGFGGSVWTKEYAIGMIRHLVAIGFELFTLQLLLALCMTLVRGWVAAPAADVTFTSILVQLGSALVMLVLVWEVPKEAQGIVSGSVISGPGLIGASANLAASVTAAAAAMTGAGAMVAQAVRLASAQTGAAEARADAAARGGGGAERSRIAHAVAVTGRAVGNMAAAPANEIGRRLSGQSSGYGSAPWRMAADMGNQARLIDGDGGRPGLAGAAAALGGTAASYQPWMSMDGGYGGLSAPHQASADRSYAEWQESNPAFAAKYGKEDYVAYVQDKQAEREGRNP